MVSFLRPIFKNSFLFLPFKKAVMTRLKICFFGLLTGLFFVACGSQKITYDFDDTIDFSQFKTYKIAAASQLNLNKMDSTRFINGFIKALSDQKLSYSETPDLIILINREAHKAQSNSSLGVGLGQQTRNVGINIGGAIPIPRNATTQNVTLDFRQTNNNRLIWQSNASNTYKNNLPPEEKERLFFEFFQSILKAYPPKKINK
ncbi:MAG: hypothetical protein AUJ53_10735 [Flavobacteriaceae bacterium CG1_02_35_72]|nr:MAG: hypothetical protein AUJ53_10735 [Flavobacteriaceae bacterium CG1_02_35_72]